MIDEIAARELVNGLIDDRLIAAYRAAVEESGEDDLVLVIDSEKLDDPITAFIRLELLTDTDAPLDLLKKLDRPARQTIEYLRSDDPAFWLLVYVPGDDLISVAVAARFVPPEHELN